MSLRPASCTPRVWSPYYPPRRWQEHTFFMFTRAVAGDEKKRDDMTVALQLHLHMR